MSDNLITLPDIYDSSIEIVAEAFALKADALKAAANVESVEDGFEATQAATAMEQLKELEKGIEAARKGAKEPVLSLGRKIDGIAKDFLEDVSKERGRLSRLLGTFQAAEREKKRQAEAEARKKEREEMERIQQQQLEAMTNGDQAALEEGDKALAKIQQETKQQVAAAHSAVKGVRVRKTACFEIKDEKLLLEKRPDLFSPDPVKIRAAIKITKDIPGLDVWEETKAY